MASTEPGGPPTFGPPGAGSFAWRALPHTRWGLSSLAFLVGFVVLFSLFQVLVALGERGGDDPLDNLTLTIPGVLFMLCAVLAGVTGVLALLRGDRAIVLYAAVVLAALLSVFLFGEFLLPH